MEQAQVLLAAGETRRVLFLERKTDFWWCWRLPGDEPGTPGTTGTSSMSRAHQARPGRATKPRAWQGTAGTDKEQTRNNKGSRA